MDEKYCLRVILLADFNDDNQTDILVELLNGCGGNCCGNSYQFFINTGNGYIKSKRIGYDWDGIEIGSNTKTFEFIIETNNEGANYDFPEYKKETFIIRNNAPTIIDIVQPQKIKSKYEILSTEFKNNFKSISNFF